MNSADQSRQEAGRASASRPQGFFWETPLEQAGLQGCPGRLPLAAFELAISPYLPFPFYLGYATALLKKNGFEVLLIDAITEQMDEETYFSRMTAFAPDLVVHEVPPPPSKPIAAGQNGQGEASGARLAFVVRTSHVDPAFLKAHPFVDYVFEGEYEFTLLELAQNSMLPREGSRD